MFGLMLVFWTILVSSVFPIYEDTKKINQTLTAWYRLDNEGWYLNMKINWSFISRLCKGIKCRTYLFLHMLILPRLDLILHKVCRQSGVSVRSIQPEADFPLINRLLRNNHNHGTPMLLKAKSQKQEASGAPWDVPTFLVWGQDFALLIKIPHSLRRTYIAFESLDPHITIHVQYGGPVPYIVLASCCEVEGWHGPIEKLRSEPRLFGVEVKFQFAVAASLEANPRAAGGSQNSGECVRPTVILRQKFKPDISHGRSLGASSCVSRARTFSRTEKQFRLKQCCYERQV